MNKRLVKITLVSILTVGLVVAAFYWNEACKEIVFLCGNFKKGVPEQSVHRQLDTGNLLRYRTEKLASGKRIIVDSAYNLSLYKCIIDIDESGLVIEVALSKSVINTIQDLLTLLRTFGMYLLGVASGIQIVLYLYDFYDDGIADYKSLLIVIMMVLISLGLSFLPIETSVGCDICHQEG